MRLYKHSDGYPTDTLADLVTATERADGYIAANAEFLAVFTTDRSAPAFKDMPPPGFAAQVTAAGLSWHGSAYRVEAVTDWPYCLAVFGDQGDLEWVYHVDLPKRTITVWGGDCGTPAEHFRRGPVDPRSYADCLMEDHRQNEKTAIAAHMDRLMDLGWSITPAGRAAKKRVRRTAKKAATS